MRRPVEHGAMAVAGYTSPWSAWAGDTVELHLSTSARVDRVRIVRLDMPASEPDGWRVEATDTQPQQRAFDQGSYLRIPAQELARAAPVTAIAFEMLPTRNVGERTILDAGGIRLGLREGKLFVEDGGRRLADDIDLPAGTWLSLRLERMAGGTSVGVRGHDDLAPFRLSLDLGETGWPGVGDAICLGSDVKASMPALNAKFAEPRLETGADECIWRFPTILPDGPITSTGTGPALRLECFNQPTFCVTSRRWDGSSFDPRLMPAHYDAVHCHDDDTGPLDWPPTHSVNVPGEAPPGIYAFEIEAGGGREQIVFFVASHAPRSPLVFVVPTATYLAYADEYLPARLYEWKCEDRGHRFAIDNDLRSLYDFHHDLSGVSICSWRKPKATLRPDYAYPLCGCPHNLPVDLHLLAFCHRNGIAFDLITDHDLHEQGAAILAGHSGVVTGSHPEYMSVEMEDAFRRFAAAGGSIAYLGGNGFAATVAFRGDLMELRRSPLEAGRTWDGPVAEQAFSITNEPGGFLRSRGRGEFSLVGGAISLMGFEQGRPFTRTGASREPAFAWLFEEVENDTFGTEGMVSGAAAGYEVDATDERLGTAPDTVVLARASGFPETFFQDPSRWYPGGDEEMERRRCAEMTLRLLPAGGLIFSAGSVAWCGALPAPDETNDVGRLTLNLLKHISALPAADASHAVEQPPKRENDDA